MKSSVPVVIAVMTLLPEAKSRKYLHGGSYRPHIVVGPPTQRVAVLEGNVITEHYLGVAFVGGPESIEPGQTAEVSFALMFFPQEQYHAVIPDATFTVREGPAVVGFGTVKHVAQPGVQADVHEKP